MNIEPTLLIWGGVAFGIGAVLGYIARQKIARLEVGTIEERVRTKITHAEHQAKKIIIGAKEEAVEIITKARQEAKEIEKNFRKKEISLQRQKLALDQEKIELPRRKRELQEKLNKARELKSRLAWFEQEKERQLQRIAKMNSEEAKKELLFEIEKTHKEDLTKRLLKLEKEGEERFEAKAKEILASVAQRALPSFISELTTTQVTLPNDEIKGRIIGKEGRNIKTFEEKTGVQIIIDETPGVIFLSSFDPQRREIARIVLQNLIKDGRIHPARIEKEVEKIEKKMPEILKKIGKETAIETKVFDLDEKLYQILGRLKFRTSFGQNVLAHSLEVAHLARRLAEELGADSQVAKKAGLLHDIGKAIDLEIEGSHVEIGIKILQKFNIEQDVIKAMRSHHEEYPYESLEAIIVQIADAISSSRPGARKETEEFYLERLENLERIAMSFEGVKKAWVVEAGREIRVFVNASEVDDFESRRLSREIAKRIEEELNYPGEIKVVVIRESRIVEYAR